MVLQGKDRSQTWLLDAERAPFALELTQASGKVFIRVEMSGPEGEKADGRSGRKQTNHKRWWKLTYGSTKSKQSRVHRQQRRKTLGTAGKARSGTRPVLDDVTEMQRAVFNQVMEKRFLQSGASVDKRPSPALRQELTTEHQEQLVDAWARNKSGAQ